MKDPNNFRDQLTDLINKHDGFSSILERYGIDSKTAAERMIKSFLGDAQFNKTLAAKLKNLDIDTNKLTYKAGR